MTDHDNELETRVRALEGVLGPADEMHLHGLMPFFVGLDLGGTPDIITFSNLVPPGKLYVTAELVGTKQQPPNKAGQYELAVCQVEPDDWAVGIMSKLAYYTLETILEHGQTMEIEPAVPPGSNIVAFLFRRIAEYEAFGKPANVICCVGITRSELEHCFKHGSASLMSAMPDAYLLTETNRRSFV